MCHTERPNEPFTPPILRGKTGLIFSAGKELRWKIVKSVGGFVLAKLGV